jgi:phosphate transport system substrate-binding protein
MRKAEDQMKKLSVCVCAALAALSLAACAGGEETVVVQGSTSMERVVATLAEQYQKDTGVTVSVEGGGSSAGVEAVLSGTAQLGLCSRNLTDEEKAQGLEGVTLALDGIAVIVSGDNPVEDLTAEEIGAIFMGEISSWAQVGGAEGAIACVGREAGSGTREGFESVTGTAGRCVLAQELTSSGAVVEAVRGNPQAIGYTALSAAEGQEGVKILTVGGVSCTEETILDGSYPLQRPFLLVKRQGEALSQAAQGFLDWAVSQEAADLIRRAGAVPVSGSEGEDA